MLNLNTRICGVEIRQMTLRHLIILEGIDSPLLCNRTPLPEQVVQFLWVLSPKFSKSDLKLSRFIESARVIPYGEAVVQIRRFISDTFQDSPPSSGIRKWDPPQVSFAASMIYILTTVLHWSREVILDLPLKEAFQYLKLHRMSNSTGPAAAGFNPSDAVKWRHIRAVREQRKLCKLRNRVIELLQHRRN